MDYALEKFCQTPVEFHVKWEPKAGLSIKANGNPMCMALVCCFSLIHILKGTFAKEQTPAEVCKTIRISLDVARELYEYAKDMIIIDIDEIKKAAAKHEEDNDG